MFCKGCGRNIEKNELCPYCGARQKGTVYPGVDDWKNIEIRSQSKRSMLTAALLQIFLGAFGVGRFYLGYKKIAFLQILATFCTFGIGGFIWGLVDGILILSGREKLDADGKFLNC